MTVLNRREGFIVIAASLSLLDRESSCLCVTPLWVSCRLAMRLSSYRFLIFQPFCYYPGTLPWPFLTCMVFLPVHTPQSCGMHNNYDPASKSCLDNAIDRSMVHSSITRHCAIIHVPPWRYSIIFRGMPLFHANITHHSLHRHVPTAMTASCLPDTMLLQCGTQRCPGSVPIPPQAASRAKPAGQATGISQLNNLVVVWRVCPRDHLKCSPLPRYGHHRAPPSSPAPILFFLFLFLVLAGMPARLQ